MACTVIVSIGGQPTVWAEVVDHEDAATIAADLADQDVTAYIDDPWVNPLDVVATDGRRNTDPSGWAA
jgi:hypothetical protein